MNVLFLDQFSDLGGAQRCLLDLLPALPPRGWQAHVAAPGDGELRRRAEALGVTGHKIHCGPFSSGHKTPSDIARFALETPQLRDEVVDLIESVKADLIYANGPRVLPAVTLAAHGRLPVLFHAHSLLSGFPLKTAGWAIRNVCARVVGACRYVAKPLQRYGGVRVVYNGIAPAPVQVALLKAGAPRIGVVGRIAAEKGQADFLRAARLVHAARPECRFVICGAPLFADPAAVAYREELDALGAGLPVEFTGWTDEVNQLLASLDLLVVPSGPVDATPRVILEAFAAGVPVLAFASGGIPEIVEHNVTGFLVQEPSPDALAAAIRDLLAEPDHLREVSSRALERSRTAFSLERYREQILESMQEALRR